MPHARLVRLPLRWRPAKLPIAILATIALPAEPRVGTASSITSRILIDPVGEYTGDVFGCSVAWVGDVNGDGYDDLLIGAFRYPEIQSHGQAYLYFGGPAIDVAADLVIPAPAGNVAWFGISVASAGDFNGDGYPDFIIGAQQSGYEGKAFIYCRPPDRERVAHGPGDPHLAAKRAPEWCLLRGRDARGPPADPQDGLVGRSALNGRR